MRRRGVLGPTGEFSGKRAVEEETSSSVKKERIASHTITVRNSVTSQSPLRQVRKREQNDMNDSKVVVRDMFNKNALHSLPIQIASLLLRELRQMRKKSEMPRRRIAGKRAVEDDVSESSKKERLECTDLSLVSPSPETTSVETDSELRLRLRSKRPAVDSQVEQSKRSRASELSIVPWSASSREKRGGRRNAIKETVRQ